MTHQIEDEAGNAAEPLTGAEVEIKLSGEPRALEAVFASKVIEGRATGRRLRKQLENVYYDTVDQRLRARGLAFRVRKDGRSYQQTLKSNDAEGLVTHRGEWQAPLPSAEPDLAVMPPGAHAVLDPLVDPGELQRLFTTRVRRQVQKLVARDASGGETLVEAALDLGEIETAAGTEPIAEVELELLEGSPSVLYDLALELDQLAPLHLETRSKSARGYALATGAPPAWHKAAALTFGPMTTVDEAMRTIFRACVQHWCANEAAAMDGGDPEGVHQMRVGLRRLRSAFAVFGKLIEPAERAWLTTGAKTIVGATGPARDWDVFATEMLPPVLGARPDDPHLVALRGAAEAARARSHPLVRAMVQSPDYTRYLLRARRWIEAGGWRDAATDEGRDWLDRPIADFAARLLDRRHRKAKKQGRRFAKLSVEDRHQLRITLKKLRYAAEFFESLYPARRTRGYIAALKQLQDGLGHLNDVAVAEPLVVEAIDHVRARKERDSVAIGGGLLLGWYARVVTDTGPATVGAWKAFAGRKPFWHRVTAA
jgi:triphosphatase